MKAKIVVMLAFAAGLLAGSAPAAVTHAAATIIRGGQSPPIYLKVGKRDHYYAAPAAAPVAVAA